MVWALCLGFCGALIGRLGATHLVNKFAHPSIIVLSLALLLVLALVLLIVNAATEPAQWEFTNLCDLD